MKEDLKPIIDRLRKRFEGQNPNVLLVDDEEPIRELLATCLTECGFTCFETGDGRSASVIYKAQLREDRFRLVIMDDRMPGGNGDEALRKILEAHPEATVFMHTTASRERLFWGAAVQFDKPAKLQDLLAAIEIAL